MKKTPFPYFVTTNAAGVTWFGDTADMNPQYAYIPENTFYFTTKDEAREVCKGIQNKEYDPDINRHPHIPNTLIVDWDQPAHFHTRYESAF